jgi:hypothetical protein
MLGTGGCLKKILNEKEILNAKEIILRAKNALSTHIYSIHIKCVTITI